MVSHSVLTLNQRDGRFGGRWEWGYAMERRGKMVCLLVMLIFSVSSVGIVQAADLSKAKGTVDNIRQADPPKAQPSNRTQQQAIKEYKESGRANPGPNTLKTTPPPAPKVDRNNPTGDKQVQKGFDDNQKKYKK
jgi:hypothetical protein